MIHATCYGETTNLCGSKDSQTGTIGLAIDCPACLEAMGERSTCEECQLTFPSDQTIECLQCDRIICGKCQEAHDDRYHNDGPSDSQLDAESTGSYFENPTYRQSMKDAGRGHLLS